MADPFMQAAVVILATVAAALIRAFWGPGRVDRIMAAQLVGTGVIGIALTLGAARQEAAMLDAALIGTLLATVSVSAYVRGRASEQAGRGGSGAIGAQDSSG